MCVWDLVLVDDDFGVDAGIVRVAEDLHDSPDRTARRRGPLRDLDDDHVVLLSVASLSARDAHVHGQPLVEWNDMGQTRSLQIEPADHRR
jgi:hypothetical protein